MKRSVRTLLPLPIVVMALLVPGAALAKAESDVVGVRIGTRCELTPDLYDRIVVDISGQIVGLDWDEDATTPTLTVTTKNVPFDDGDFVDANDAFTDETGWVFKKVVVVNKSIQITLDKGLYADEFRVSVLKGGFDGQKGIYRLVIDAWETGEDECPPVAPVAP